MNINSSYNTLYKSPKHVAKKSTEISVMIQSRNIYSTSYSTVSRNIYNTSYSTVSRNIYSTSYSTVSRNIYSTSYSTVSRNIYSTSYSTVIKVDLGKKKTSGVCSQYIIHLSMDFKATNVTTNRQKLLKSDKTFSNLSLVIWTRSSNCKACEIECQNVGHFKGTF